MTERCCPAGQCAYRVEAIEATLAAIRGARARGEDPTAASVLARTSNVEGGVQPAPGGSGLCHGQVRVWDVEQARAALGSGATATQIAGWLCPFALDDSTHQVS